MIVSICALLIDLQELAAGSEALRNRILRSIHEQLEHPQGHLCPRFPLARGPRAPARPGLDPVPQGPVARHPRLRRRVQRRGQPGRLLRPEDRHRHGDGQLPDRRAGAGAASARWASRRSTSGSSTTACAGRTSPRSTATAATASAPPVVFYNRANEAGALLKPGDFDWATIFAGGVRWFHSGGIFAALSETTSELIIEGMQAAKAAGAITSFDLNYRAKLWASVGGAEKGQRGDRAGSSSNVDALIGNEEDLQKGLGIAGPGRRKSKSKLDPDTFFQLIDRVVEQAPQHQARGDDPARGALDQPPRLGGRALARRPALRQPDAASSTSSTASAAATASPPA